MMQTPSNSQSSIFYSPILSPMEIEEDLAQCQAVAINCFQCLVCAQPAHGNHFGAISCRACAAFFRRAITGAKTVYKCKKDNHCDIWKNGRYLCKKCRLVKCHEVGMDPGRFQLDRDLISATEQFMSAKNAKRAFFMATLPETVEHFLGRPHWIIFMEPQVYTEKNFIDLQHLVEKASELLELGSEKPIFAKNNLEKLALGLNSIRDRIIDKDDVQLVKRLGKDEALSLWEKDFLAVARWFTFFDDFQQLPHDQQVFILKAVWHVWMRLEKLHLTARSRQQNFCEKKHMMLWYDSAYDPKTVDVDLSWCTKYPKEQILHFFDEVEDWAAREAIEPLMELQPTDIELSYMLCQLCFHYAGKRFQGEILEVMERFQDSLANNLHDYYIKEMNMPRYCGRLNQMLKINNIIQQNIWEQRAKQEVAKVFDIFCIEFSHPEMFADMT